MSEKEQILLKRLEKKTFEKNGFVFKFLLVDDNMNSLIFDVQIENTKSKSWNYYLLEGLIIKIMDTISYPIFLDKFKFYHQWMIGKIFVDGKEISDKSFYFSEDIKNKINSEIKKGDFDIKEKFESEYGFVNIEIVPYKYNLISSQDSFEFECHYKINKFTLERYYDKTLNFTRLPHKLIRDISSYFSWGTYVRYDELISSKIYDILNDEFMLQTSSSYVNTTIIVDKDMEDKKVKVTYETYLEDLEVSLNQFLSKI